MSDKPKGLDAALYDVTSTGPGGKVLSWKAIGADQVGYVTHGAEDAGWTVKIMAAGTDREVKPGDLED